MTTLREKFINFGAKVVRHAKYVRFQLAEVAVPRRLFAARPAPRLFRQRLIVSGREPPRNHNWGHSIRSTSIFVCSVLTLPGLVPAQSGPPLPSSQPSPGPEIVPGKDVPHWSGLPIWGKAEAEKYGFELPLPIGLSGTYFAEKEGFRMPELKLGGHGGRLLDAGGLVRVPDIKISESAKLLRLDGWVLPFLNLYGLVGDVNGYADIDIEPAMFPPKCSPKFKLRLDYEGPTVGVGSTLAAGFKPFKGRPTIVFGLADLNFTETFLDFEHVVTSLEPVAVTVLNARGGVRDRILRTPKLGDVYMSVWGGIMWEGVQEVMSGNVSIFDLDFQGKARSLNSWNPIVGAGLEIGKHINVMIDVGFGERESLMLSATFRF